MIGAVQSKNRPVEPEPSRRFNLLFTVEGSGIQGSKHQANSKIYGNTLKIDFAHTFMFCRVLYPNYRGIVYLSKYDFVFEKYLF